MFLTCTFFFTEGDRLSPVISDIKLETDSDFGSVEDIPSLLDTRYQPRSALRIALSEWMGQLRTSRQPPHIKVPAVPALTDPLPSNMICTGGNDSFMQPAMLPISNSLLSASQESVSDSVSVSDSDTSVELEPMDCLSNADDLADMAVEPEVKEELTYDDIQMVADFFFLPFEHGTKSSQLLNDLHWLKSNANLMSDKNADTNAVSKTYFWGLW